MLAFGTRPLGEPLKQRRVQQECNLMHVPVSSGVGLTWPVM